jgi:Protein of unknown function (DUF1116)
MLDSAKGFPGSSMVTAMARNGVNFGIQVSGLGDQWFEAPAATINGLYFSGYSPADANPDLGDSAITETAGIGGFAMAAAPAIVGFVGGTVEDALAHTQRMRQICIGENPSFTIPSLVFKQPALASTFVPSSTLASSPSSTPASPTAKPASDKSAPE